MKFAERIVMLGIAGLIIGGGVWFYVTVKQQQISVRDAVAQGKYEIRPEEPKEINGAGGDVDWRTVYPMVVPMQIGNVTVKASVADTLSERIKGLSNTPFLPEQVVKLFVFGVAGEHPIWMKDMKYSLDIMWLDETGEIVHIEEDIAPETYPNAFSSPVPAWYVIETNAGFVANNGLVIGDKVSLPN